MGHPKLNLDVSFVCIGEGVCCWLLLVQGKKNEYKFFSAALPFERNASQPGVQLKAMIMPSLATENLLKCGMMEAESYETALLEILDKFLKPLLLSYVMLNEGQRKDADYGAVFPKAFISFMTTKMSHVKRFYIKYVY